MILQTIKCSIKDCGVSFTEIKPNTGFPGWGHIIGIYDDETGEERAHLCPHHLAVVKKILNNEIRWII